MDDSFFAYLQQLELMAFFSGYSLIYSLALFFTGTRSARNNNIRISGLLPYAYALAGTLYLGLQLKNLYPDYSIENIKLVIQQPFLISWALLSLIFWIPVMSKKPVLSLIHSLVFFFFLLRDLFIQIADGAADKNIIRNDMKIYTVSLLINIGALLLIVSLSFLFRYFKNRSKFPP